MEVDPVLKRKLYLVLEQNQTTLKDWFLDSASVYIKQNSLKSLSDLQSVAEDNSPYDVQVKK